MKVRELLSDKSKWTKGAYARDTKGEPVYEDKEKAVCWCLSGAIFKCYPGREFMDVVDRVHEKVFPHNIPSFNDTTTFEKVKALVEELDI